MLYCSLLKFMLSAFREGMEALLNLFPIACAISPNLKNCCQASKRQLNPVKLARHHPHSLSFRTSNPRRTSGGSSKAVEYQSASDEHDGKSDEPLQPSLRPVLCSHQVTSRLLASKLHRQMDSTPPHSPSSPSPNYQTPS